MKRERQIEIAWVGDLCACSTCVQAPVLLWTCPLSLNVIARPEGRKDGWTVKTEHAFRVGPPPPAHALRVGLQSVLILLHGSCRAVAPRERAEEGFGARAP